MMASHRFEIGASAGPAREGVLHGRAMLLVRVRLFDGPGVVDGLTGEPAGDEDVYTDLRPDAAHDLAFRLLECAELVTEQARLVAAMSSATTNPVPSFNTTSAPAATTDNSAVRS